MCGNGMRSFKIEYMRFPTLRFFSLSSSTSKNLCREMLLHLPLLCASGNGESPPTGASPLPEHVPRPTDRCRRRQQRGVDEQRRVAEPDRPPTKVSFKTSMTIPVRASTSVLSHHFFVNRDYSAIQEQTKKTLQLMQQLQAAQRAQANNQPEEIVIDGSPTFSAAPVKTYQVDEGSCHL